MIANPIQESCVKSRQEPALLISASKILRRLYGGAIVCIYVVAPGILDLVIPVCGRAVTVLHGRRSRSQNV